MTDNTQELMDKEALEPTDERLEIEALMEEIGEKIEIFTEFTKVFGKKLERQSVSEQIDEKIERFVELTKEAGNLVMGKAVKKRWLKIKKMKKIKE